jgi:ornithine cyclodeaminase/alanine dehydrogenase-like protein (mu-crystallin family)
MRVLSTDDVERLLTPELAMASAEEAYRVFSSGEAQVPPRSEIHRSDPDGVALIMSGLIGSRVLGMKLVGDIAASDDRARRYTTCLILVWDAATLEPRGLISADALNDHRTAAGIAVGTRLLARANSATHVLFGTGKLSFPCANYIARVRPIRRLIIVGRTPANIDALVERLRTDPLTGKAEVMSSLTADAAVAEADIITTVTRSSVPLFDGRCVRPGTHINLGGAMRRHEREMDDAVAGRARFYLDSEAVARERAGDLALPLERGILSNDRVAGEIGNVILGRIAGRANNAEITVFRSMGIAAQDLCLGASLLDAAERRDIGQRVRL